MCLWIRTPESQFCHLWNGENQGAYVADVLFWGRNSLRSRCWRTVENTAWLWILMTAASPRKLARLSPNLYHDGCFSWLMQRIQTFVFTIGPARTFICYLWKTFDSRSRQSKGGGGLCAGQAQTVKACLSSATSFICSSFEGCLFYFRYMSYMD